MEYGLAHWFEKPNQDSETYRVTSRKFRGTTFDFLIQSGNANMSEFFLNKTAMNNVNHKMNHYQADGNG